jgi:hypothetical protein
MNETELIARLERLEGDNRRMKRLGIAALALAAGLGLMAAERPVPDVIKAKGFDVVDNQGRIRAALYMDFRGDPRFYLRGADGTLRAELSCEADDTSLALYDANGRDRETLQVFKDLPSIWLRDRNGEVNVSIHGGLMLPSFGPGIMLGIADKGQAVMDLSVTPKGEATIELQDAQGFRMDLGSIGTMTPRTGETQQTSAASIVMFGNEGEHHVIWRAP